VMVQVRQDEPSQDDPRQNMEFSFHMAASHGSASDLDEK
jgi:hypothetical protein